MARFWQNGNYVSSFLLRYIKSTILSALVLNSGIRHEFILQKENLQAHCKWCSNKFCKWMSGVPSLLRDTNHEPLASDHGAFFFNDGKKKIWKKHRCQNEREKWIHVANLVKHFRKKVRKNLSHSLLMAHNCWNLLCSKTNEIRNKIRSSSPAIFCKTSWALCWIPDFFLDNFYGIIV